LFKNIYQRTPGRGIGAVHGFRVTFNILGWKIASRIPAARRPETHNGVTALVTNTHTGAHSVRMRPEGRALPAWYRFCRGGRPGIV